MVEAIGTFLLVLATLGASQKAASHHSPGLLALDLLISGVASGAALSSLIVALGTASGAHFNPLITVSQWLAGQRGTPCAAGYALGQCVGAVAAAGVASMTFGIASAAQRPTPMVWESIVEEGLATAGLLLIAIGCARSGKTDVGPFAVGAWVVGMTVALPGPVYANPAIAIASNMLSLASLGQIGVLAQHLSSEAAGMVMALGAVTIAYPTDGGGRTKTSSGENRG